MQLRSVEVLVSEIGEAFNGIDPLRPVFREKLVTAKDDLLEIKGHVAYLGMEIVLRDPLDEEIGEIRSLLEGLPARN